MGVDPCRTGLVSTGLVRPYSDCRYDRLCLANLHRRRDAGRPEPLAWAATADQEMTGYRPLPCCEMPGCEFGQL